MITKLARFRDVLEGHAHVVTVKSKSVRDRFRSDTTGRTAIRVSGNKVVIPRRTVNERARFDKRTGEITTTSRGYGGRTRSILFAARSFDDLFKFETDSAKLGRVYQYTLQLPRLGGFETTRFLSIKEMYDFLGSSAGLAAARNNLAKYVSIETFDPDSENDGEE